MNTNIRPGKDKKKSSGKKKTVKANKSGGGEASGNASGNEEIGPSPVSASKKKRRELSTNATKTINKHKFKVVLDFD